jgi:hypothetical protein
MTRSEHFFLVRYFFIWISIPNQCTVELSLLRVFLRAMDTHTDALKWRSSIAVTMFRHFVHRFLSFVTLFYALM